MARRTLFSDLFTGTNADLGTSWDRYASINGLQRVSDTAQGEVINAAADCLESHSGTLPNDQWIEAVLAANVPSEYNSTALGLRWAAPNTASGYLLIIDSSAGANRISLQKVTAGALALLTASPSNFVTLTLAGNDVMRFEAVGTTLIGYQNDTQRIQVTGESTWTGGRAALEVYPTVSLANAVWDSFASGDFTPPPLVFHPLQA